MNRTVKDATVKTFHYDDLESPRADVLAFVTAYNFAKQFKALKWKTPLQNVFDAWKSNPSAFKISPHRRIAASCDRTPGTWARGGGAACHSRWSPYGSETRPG
jgi:hypothetical protein